MKTRKFAVIGCQHAHIKMFIGEMIALGHECAGIYEPENTALARSLAEEFAIPLADDPERLLAEPVEVVGCASINSEKIDVIELCERHGKHVMLDKPAVTDWDGYRRLESVIRRGNIHVGMLLTERFRPAVYTLKRQVDLGVFGRIVSIGMRKPHRLNPANRPPWFFLKSRNGGIVVDLLVHDFDLLRWLTGKEVLSVDGTVGKFLLPEHPTFEDTACFQVLMEDGIVAQLYADWHTPEKSWTWGDCRIFVAGTEGCAELRLNGDPLVANEEILFRVTHREPPQRVEPEQPPLTITEDFLNRIDGKASLLTHRDILEASRLTLEADERARRVGLRAKEGDIDA